MTDTLIPVPFMGASLALIDHQGEPYAAMKPIVQALGMDWKGQHAKIKARYGATTEEISTVAEDGKQRTMTCLPLRKLPAWLATIQPNKTRPELRERIRAYQAECDDALWAYWAQGKAERHAPAPLPAHVQNVNSLELKTYPAEGDREIYPCYYMAQQAIYLAQILMDKAEKLCFTASYAMLEASRAACADAVVWLDRAKEERAQEGRIHG